MGACMDFLGPSSGHAAQRINFQARFFENASAYWQPARKMITSICTSFASPKERTRHVKALFFAFDRIGPIRVQFNLQNVLSKKSVGYKRLCH